MESHCQQGGYLLPDEGFLQRPGIDFLGHCFNIPSVEIKEGLAIEIRR
jgi:hypothetical protein